ncbi:MAG: hypothetical protein IPN91_03495 [Holophagaceae bacterium]|uniref:Alginate export domain-containing protein n=1 Tax=Candidatus Geothrix odensensis TaxID=2954440 RepID=A0A936F051_9BACT|nr:hypothetical protein [Candidatus Geothrix odensensis]
MKISRIAGIAALLTAGFASAQTPTVKIEGVLLEFWATQMMDNNLRYNSTAAPGAGNAAKYYTLDSRFQENNFAVKRSEIYMSGTVTDTISWNLMFDPNNSNTTAAPNNVLQDFVLTWAPVKGFNIKAGQFKMPTAYEATLVAAREILFFERNQINRRFADARDRGIWASYTYGDAKAFQGKLNFAISNGTTEDGAGGKNNENTLTGAGNAQKDYTFRFESTFLSKHKAGAYYREGVTNLKDSSMSAATVPASWTVGAPSATQIKDNKDKTTLMGAYYAFNTANFQVSAEYATGLLGRRYPSLRRRRHRAPARAPRPEVHRLRGGRRLQDGQPLDHRPLRHAELQLRRQLVHRLQPLQEHHRRRGHGQRPQPEVHGNHRGLQLRLHPHQAVRGQAEARLRHAQQELPDPPRRPDRRAGWGQPRGLPDVVLLSRPG